MTKRLQLDSKHLPLAATIGLFIMMFIFGSLRYTGFFSTQVFLNLFIDNAFLIVVAVGMTFVILSGGIDLSVGSIIALTSMVAASLTMNTGLSPVLVIPLSLLVGTVLGFCMGCFIHYFNLQPFIVTLAGMFLARGLCYLISVESITINNEFFSFMASTRIPVGGGNFISISVIIAMLVVIAAIFVAHFSKFGRNVYALGGSEQSALLMGLPVGKTKIMIYTVSGFCSSLAGLIFTFYMLSGYGLHANGLELDTIAAVVIGGTLLTGGAGYVAGSVVGVLILGIIQTVIVFEGTLSSWWTKIAIGALLLLFIVLQRVIVARSKTNQSSIAAH
ncbi:galactofuranose ABC transporter, permease protein YjfF [Metabacillus sediminilitoris]|uniref:Sugar ABC transporter permease YjfF n=1 Tax=Metabacillus sediminilitoris TaxID=2567941 RepID=A0A4S4BUU1_9BACI|nr:galactofuranose ABC transporter, permease protein YjfF [Metabacillus sediminilitoris]QGQ44786.1 sugar ABC transporter permease YjfF [Metabacillus sediminilitoris]THF78866.1 sugar ABC transporter permease YjfF [Metabacillus sediminilitoris]